jgi:predicted PurR-regulated permease PerM
MTEVLIHRPRHRPRIVFLSISAATAVALLVLSREVLLPFVFALVVAYVLMPAVRWVQRGRLPRWIAILTVYAATLGGLYASGRALAPRLALEMRGLVRELPTVVATFQEQQLPRFRRWYSNMTGTSSVDPDPDANDAPPPPTAGPMRIVPRPDGSYEIDFGPGLEIQQVAEGRFRLVEVPVGQNRPFEFGRWLAEGLGRGMTYVQQNTMQAFKLGKSIVQAVSRTIFVFFMTLMLAAYLMLTQERIQSAFRSLVFPSARRSFDLLLARIDRGLAGVVRGQLLICLVNGVLSAIGFWMFGLKHWPILALVAAVMSIIPVFGSILSSIPIVAMALTQSLTLAIEVLLWIVGIHQLEANFLNPKIIGDAARIHPVLVIFSLLVGEHFFALPGALLAVPTMSIAQSLFVHFRNATFGEDAPRDSFVPPPPSCSNPPPSRPSSPPSSTPELVSEPASKK